MKVLFVYNPSAGQVKIKNYLFNILNIFASAGYDLSVFPTRAPKEAYEKVKKDGADYDLIVVGGGDGTLNEVLNGYIGLSPQPLIGYLPAGTTNDFALGVGLEKKMDKAAESVVEGTLHEYDAGIFNDGYFVYVAAFGAFSAVSYSTAQSEKNLLGHLAYLLEGAKSLSSIETIHARIAAEEFETEDDFIFGMVSNAYSVGGVYKMKESEVSLSDGLFEVLLVKRPHSLKQLRSISVHLLGGEKSPYVISFKTRKIVLSFPKAVAFALDGEFGGEVEEARIEVLDKALKMQHK